MQLAIFNFPKYTILKCFFIYTNYKVIKNTSISLMITELSLSFAIFLKMPYLITGEFGELFGLRLTSLSCAWEPQKKTRLTKNRIGKSDSEQKRQEEESKTMQTKRITRTLEVKVETCIISGSKIMVGVYMVYTLCRAGLGIKAKSPTVTKTERKCQPQNCGVYT